MSEIFLEIPEQMLTVEFIKDVGLLIIGLFGFYEVIKKMIKDLNARHDKEQTWDQAVLKIEEARKEFGRQYDQRLDDMDAKFTASMQQITAEQCIIIETQQAILDGLSQLKCNGPVTEQKHKLDDYLNKRAHADI